MPDLAIGWIDAVVLLAYLMVAVGMGFLVAQGQRSLDGYLLGGRDVSWWVILGSIVATETSTATFLSVPGIAYAKGTGDLRFLQLTFGYVIGRCIIVVLFLPSYFRGELFSAYEVLHQRFGGSTRTVASLVFLITRNLGDGLRLFLTAIALEQVLSWPLPACVIVIGLVTIVYTVFGGMKSVVWNDCLQMIIYLVGGCLAAWILIQKLPDGWSTFVDYGFAEHKFRVLDFRWDLAEPFTFWAGVIGGMFLTLGTHGTDQMMVQRLLCARNQKDAGKALIASGFCVSLQFAFFLLLGVALACFYATLQPGRVFDRSDRVFASFIVEELPANVGIIGLLLAAILAAAMSTLSSSLNSSATAVVNDFMVPQRVKPMTQKQLIQWIRTWTVFFWMVQIAIGIGAQQVQSSVVSSALAVAGFSAGLLLGVFALGVLTKSVRQRACLIGILSGTVVLLSVRFLLPWFVAEWKQAGLAVPPLFVTVAGWLWPGGKVELAWPWLPVVGAVSTFVIGLCAQSLSGLLDSGEKEGK